MKRIVVGVVLAAASLLLAVPAGADDEIPVGSSWGGSNVTPVDPVTGPSSEITVVGRIQNGVRNSDPSSASAVTYSAPDVSLTFHLTAPPDGSADDGCDIAPDGPATDAELDGPTFDRTLAPTWKRYSYTADVPFSPVRNGGYRLYVCINGVPRISTEVLVRLPAPIVTNLVATADGHTVNLSWDDIRGGAPDLSGYRVERAIGGGTFEALSTVGAEATTFSDTSLPTAGGEATYRVVGLRPLVSDATPSNTSAATFSAAAPGATDGGTPGTGGSGGGGGAPGGGSGPGSGGGSSTRRPARQSGPTIRVPRVGTPSRSFFPALLAPPEVDTFDEALPYDLTDGGEEALGDELADEPLEALPGRGLAIPVATGLVLAVWALHLRFLARASRPEYYDDRIEVWIER